MSDDWQSLGHISLYKQWKKIRPRLFIRLAGEDHHFLIIETCTDLLGKGAVNLRTFRIFFTGFASIVPNNTIQAKGIKTRGINGVDQFSVEIRSR